MFGHIEGRRHDATLLRKSEWNDKLETNLNINSTQLYIYGNSAYPLRPWIKRIHRSPVNEEQSCSNQAMIAVRASVEHSYEDVKQQ